MDKGCFFMICSFVGSLLIESPVFQELLMLVFTIYTAMHNEILSAYLGTVILLYVCVLAKCHMLILSGILKLRPKPSAKGRDLLDLVDADLQFEDEPQLVPFFKMTRLSQFFNNTFEFCKFRPVYGILLFVGILFLTVFFTVKNIFKDEVIQQDLHLATLQLIVPSILLVAIPLFISNSGIYSLEDQEKTYSYRPFQKEVEIPMKVMTGRSLAAFLYGGYWKAICAASLLIFVFFTCRSLIFLHHMTETEIKAMQEQYQPRVLFCQDVHMLLSTFLGLATALGIACLANLTKSACNKAKLNTFAIIEKNWRRNLQAMKSLLVDMDWTLKQLEDLLSAKKTRKPTPEEKRAFAYIELPLWQTKRPFIRRYTMGRHQQILTEDEPGHASSTEGACKQPQTATTSSVGVSSGN